MQAAFCSLMWHVLMWGSSVIWTLVEDEIYRTGDPPIPTRDFSDLPSLSQVWQSQRCPPPAWQKIRSFSNSFSWLGMFRKHRFRITGRNPTRACKNISTSREVGETLERCILLGERLRWEAFQLKWWWWWWRHEGGHVCINSSRFWLSLPVLIHWAYIYIYVLQELKPWSPVASFCVRLCCFLLISIVKFLIWCVHLFEREIFELKLDDVGGWVTIILLMCGMYFWCVWWCPWNQRLQAVVGLGV